MQVADVHSLLARPRVAQHARQAVRVVRGALARPADAGRVVEVVVLLAVGVQLAGQAEVGQLAAAGGGEGLDIVRRVAADAVQVAVEDARVAGLAEEDQRVGERLEEGLDADFEGLVGLRVVVPGRLVRSAERVGKGLGTDMTSVWRLSVFVVGILGL